MAQITPLISSRCAGPLGVLHLPRMWQKCLLHALGKLADGYPDIGKGFDAMVCAALNLDPDAVRKFIADKKPTYPQFEEWVMKSLDIKLNPATIDKLNRAILGYNHGDETRNPILSSTGYTGDDIGDYITHSAVGLNELEDWQAFHTECLAIEATPDVPTAENTSPATAAPHGFGAPDSD